MKYCGYDFTMITIRKNDYEVIAKFFNTSKIKVVFNDDGLVYPMRFKYGTMIHRVNGKIVEYSVNKTTEVKQESKQEEQLQLF